MALGYRSAQAELAFNGLAVDQIGDLFGGQRYLIAIQCTLHLRADFELDRHTGGIPGSALARPGWPLSYVPAH